MIENIYIVHDICFDCSSYLHVTLPCRALTATGQKQELTDLTNKLELVSLRLLLHAGASAHGPGATAHPLTMPGYLRIEAGAGCSLLVVLP